MRFVLSTIIAAALFTAPLASEAQLSPYGQDFETLVLTDPAALGNDGWLVFGNVFTPTMDYLYGYGPFPAPNSPPPAFSTLASGEGGDSQGIQQLSVFSDYENLDHAIGNLIESNVFQEQVVGAGDVGSTWYFEFDAKLGNLASPSTAMGFIKTLDPSAGHALTNFLQADMTLIPIGWMRYSISITIDASLVGQLLQFGFSNIATAYNASAIFYDNVEFTLTTSVDVPGVMVTGPGVELSVLGNPAIGNSAQVLAFTTPRDGRVTLRVYDVRGRLVQTLVNHELAAGVHRAVWQGRDATGRMMASGIYLAEVVAGTQRAVIKLNRLR